MAELRILPYLPTPALKPVRNLLEGIRAARRPDALNSLGCQYKKAWHMLHRIREACGKGEFTLSNVVEADETHIGAKRKNMSNAKSKSARVLSA